MAPRSARLRGIVLVWLVATQAGCAQCLRQTTFVEAVQGGKPAGVEGIEIFRDGATVPAKRRLALAPGDELRTSAVSQALIAFPDGSLVIVQPNTVIAISSLELKKGVIYVRAWARRKFEVETQLVKMTVDGTEYQVSVGENDQTSVDVAEGTIRLTSNTGSWGPVAIRGGEGAFVKAGEVPRKGTLSPEEVMRIRQQLRFFAKTFATDLINLGTPGLGHGW